MFQHLFNRRIHRERETALLSGRADKPANLVLVKFFPFPDRLLFVCESRIRNLVLGQIAVKTFGQRRKQFLRVLESNANQPWRDLTQEIPFAWIAHLVRRTLDEDEAWNAEPCCLVIFTFRGRYAIRGESTIIVADYAHIQVADGKFGKVHLVCPLVGRRHVKLKGKCGEETRELRIVGYKIHNSFPLRRKLSLNT